jgi:hypothetical protein
MGRAVTGSSAAPLVERRPCRSDRIRPCEPMAARVIIGVIIDSLRV